jgi:hypothetical protein
MAVKLAPMFVDESIDGDQWERVAFPGDHPVSLMFREASTSRVSIVDKWGTERRYRRPTELTAR